MQRFDFWQKVTLAAVGNPRVRTHKQAAHLIEGIMRMYDKEQASEAAKSQQTALALTERA